MSVIYFDHNSTTQPHREVIDYYCQYVDQPLNNLSIHSLGRKSDMLVENSRQALKKMLHADNFDIIFTSSATEAANLAIFGCNVARIIVSKIEHSAIFNARPCDKEICEFGVDKNGVVDIVGLQEIIENQPDGNFLLALMLANNETGAIQPVKEVAKMVHRKGGLLLCDIVQAVGKIAVDLEDLNVDLAIISAHKFGGLQGVGALMVRKNIEIKPIIYGGGQEKNKRAGTLNVAGIASLIQACKIAQQRLFEYEQKVGSLQSELENNLRTLAGNDIIIFSEEVNRLPNTTFFATKKCLSQTQLMQYDLNNICVSSGTTCSSGATFQSRVLREMDVDKEFIDCAVRVSLGFDNNKSQIDQFIDVWQRIYNKNKLN